ncbi:MAG: pitrilysin family protein [Candidatus Dojkabacteria bacterium]|nr:pitrilysin family protein [Candidatus Dojkabacteria bacterium]
MNDINRKGQFSILTLENGLKALLYPLDRVNSVSIIAIVNAGHFSEKVEENGVAHLLEHTLFDGTRDFPDFRALNDFFDQMAGSLSGTTSYDFITAGGTFVDEEVDNAFFAVKQLIFQPLLLEKDVQKEKGIILDELATLEDSNDYKNFLNAKRIRFRGKTILSLPMGGTSDSLEKISVETVKKYHNKYFCPNNVRIVVVGKCKEEQLKAILEKHFSEFKPNPKLQLPHFEQDQFSGKVISLIDESAKKSYIRITFPSYSWKDNSKDRVALAYICSLLANRRDSLLFSHLREHLGWIYDIGADFMVGHDIGAFEIETSTPIDKSLSVIEEILKSMKHIKIKPFDKLYFERIKDIDRKNMKMVFDTPEGILRWFGEEIVYRYPKIILPKDLIKIYNEIQVSDLQRVAENIIDMTKINISVLQPFGKIDEKKYKERVEELIDKFS